MPFPNEPYIRNTILQHFKRRKKGFLYNEETLIGIIESPSSSKNDVYYGVLGLRDVGTEKCIPVLKELQSYPMMDVKDCSLLTISHIAGSKETRFFTEVLERKGSRKDYAMLSIVDSANSEAVNPVINYLEKVYKKLKQPKCDYAGDAFVEGLIYLSKQTKNRDEIEELFNKFIKIKGKLSEGEKERLCQEINYFKDRL